MVYKCGNCGSVSRSRTSYVGKLSNHNRDNKCMFEELKGMALISVLQMQTVMSSSDKKLRI